VVSWHDEMSRYIDSIDPGDHLLTTSAAVDQLESLDTIPTMDNLQYHLYKPESQLLNQQIDLDRRFLAELKHTSIINGEYGTDDGADTPSDMQRHAVWIGIMTQVPRYMWIWEHYKNPSWANIFNAPATFLEGEDLAGNGGPLTAGMTPAHDTRGLKALGIKKDTSWFGYVYDPVNNRDIAGATVTLYNLPVGWYTLTCNSAILGNQLLSDTLALFRGTETIEMPVFSKGVAFKLKYHDEYTLPVADAGPDTTVAVGSPACLDGSGSIAYAGGALTCLWTLEERPAGSQATLEDEETMEPTLTPDLPGHYRVSLVVSEGQNQSAPDEVVIRASSPPVADAGPDTTVLVTENHVRLSGTGSYDPEGDPISYSWELVSAPEMSQQLVSGKNEAEVVVVTDAVGAFVMVLTVSDLVAVSVPDTAVVTVVDQAEHIDPEPDLRGITCYPNPSGGTLRLSVPAGEILREVTITAPDGRTLFQIKDRYPGPGTYPLDLREHIQGEHAVIIRITGSSSVRSQLIILQKP